MTELTMLEARGLASTMKIAADPVRLQLISLLAYRPGRQTDLLAGLRLAGTGIGLSTMSKHLGRLVGAGLVSRTWEGRDLTYRLVPETFETMAGLLRAAGDR